jgi:uncharacterized YigZ family protein
MSYKTVAEYARIEYTEKRSKFIATAAPVHSSEEANCFISQIKSEFNDARHNIFAYIIKDGSEKFSDDGEPQGTAGLPALGVLRRCGVVNTVVVVTRYFGGILLGAPGLVRAYTHSAASAVDKAGIVVMHECDILSLSCGYDFYSLADELLKKFGGFVKDRRFEEKVTLRVFMPKEKTAAFKKAAADASGGTLVIKNDGETFIKI